MLEDADMKPAASDEDLFASTQEETSSTASAITQSNKNNPDSSKAESDKEGIWRGTPIHKLPKNTGRDLYPPVVVGPCHSVLFKVPITPGEVPKPWPERPLDVWDQNHVRMPHSAASLYPITPTELRKRWEVVEQSLRTSITTSHQLEAAILHYNSTYSDRWDFNALHSFFSEVLEDVETEYFFTNVLPKIIDLALKLPQLVTGGVPLLRQHATRSISLTQQQISALLANAFLCTFPRRNTSKRDSEYSTFPSINFNSLFNGERARPKGRINCLHEKLKCLINYFRRVTSKIPDGVVTYSRHYVPPSDLPEWGSDTALLPNLCVTSSGTIEDQGTGMLQMDFANKFVGGGVLGIGCVQEEIRFVICPELILARLFTEVLDDTEALIVTGCERYSSYRGYSNDFEWAGNVEDTTPRDCYGRRRCTVVAIDAFRFPNTKAQYSAESINRELNKAYTGFSWGASSGGCESVATGNWGCGAFRGDARLKGLLQLMAAGRAGRQLVYFTFGDTELCNVLYDMYNFLTERRITIGDLWKWIVTYNPMLYKHSLYDHIYQCVTNGSVPQPWKSMKDLHFYKKQRTQEGDKKPVRCDEDKINNGSNRLSTEQIEKALELEGGMEEDSDNVKPVVRKTLKVKEDRELCLKRLTGSWTNLNDSKKDFGSSSRNSESHIEIVNSSTNETSVNRSKQTLSNNNKKKKITDYFQSL